MPAGADGELKLGDSDIDKIYLGDNEADKIYLGENEVWTNCVPPTQDGTASRFIIDDGSTVYIAVQMNGTGPFTVTNGRRIGGSANSSISFTARDDDVLVALITDDSGVQWITNFRATVSNACGSTTISGSFR